MDELPQEMKDAYEGIVKNNKIENFMSSQDFDLIKSKYSDRHRFTDSEFTATNHSVYFTQRFKNFLQQRGQLPLHKSSHIEWKRAKDMYGSQAHFVLDKQKRFVSMATFNESNYSNYFHTTDLDQGSLGK